MFIPIEFQKVFQKTEQQAFFIQAHYCELPNAMQSRFGGQGYWQNNISFPTDQRGKPLALLAQINFSDLPVNDVFPEKGILQFFLPRYDEYYGANIDALKGNSQLVCHFWDAPSKDKVGQWEWNVSENDLFPIFGTHALEFKKSSDFAGIDTIECAENLGANPFEVLEDVSLNEKEEQSFYDAIADFTPSYGHKLLGYPGFIHGDPREDSELRLLLQIDTDMADKNDIMWGDHGIGQIFIADEDLKAKRFDRVFLYWDY